MWMLVWVTLSPAGAINSGHIPFASQAACEAGRRPWGEMVLGLAERERIGPVLDVRCIEAATGKAAPPPAPKP